MCPVVLLAMISSFLLLFVELAATISVSFVPGYVSKLKVGEKKNVSFSITDLKPAKHDYYELLVADPSIATIVTSKIFNVTELESRQTNGETFNGTFTLEGRFLGYTDVQVKALPKYDSEDEKSNPLQISVVRKENKLNTVFIASVAILVSLSYINMGCALDLRVIKGVLKRPVAPAVGFSCQYLMMPLIAYGIGQLLFDTPILKLGLFVFGCSPGGGASNMWTVLLKGNLNLSVTMTFISTLAALVMMPLWIFTLGKTLFSGTTKIPFTNIFISLVSMVIPLGIGLLIQKYLPKVATFGRRILAPTCLILIIYIVAFGTYANLYMFKLFTWHTVVAALTNVWFGFLFGALATCFSGRPVEDVIAIAVETGIQNSGIAIVLLGFSLQQPDADLASVMPVAASIMMPIPLLMLYVFQKIRACCSRRETIDSESLISENKYKQSVESATNEGYDSIAPMN
ncbi:ileal sodium/bile acid cotransporter-like [Limulus polyphemus]|uniref:Ileal sodium/bile acid cotransporter-like n=1 Tax=Limulus polyphemus TaxID=6850 RepID=A0ABM1BZV7_LIMPO|nr:ileal sodium/bile acid cotransporter-like [Limulus polyphemus]